MAETILLPRTITAPSCSGVLCSKILMRSWLEIMPSTSMPVLSYSFKDCSCSMTISAPVLTFPISNEAFTISFTVRSENRPVSLLLESRKEATKFFRPSSSSAERSSGCRTTTNAVAAILIILGTIQRIVFILQNAAITINTRITMTPFRSAHALVFLIHTRI